jgi:hypothetical protein
MACRSLVDIQADIDDLREAIKAARRAQSASIGGRSVSAADYRAMREELAELQAEYAATEAAINGTFGVCGIPGARRL